MRANEQQNLLLVVGIDPTRIPEHAIANWKTIQFKICAKIFLVMNLSSQKSDQCDKKCSCLIDGKPESSCFGKVWSDETKNNIKKYTKIFETSELYREDIENLMEKLNN